MRFCATIFLLFFSCVTALQADVIYLKNGKKLECTGVREEGNEVKYTIAGGTVAIPKSMVIRIEKSDSKKLETLAETKIAPAPDTMQNPQQQSLSDVKTNERLARFYTDRGKEFAEKKDFHRALEQFEKAYGYFKNEATTLNLAVAYYLLKDDWNADANFREVLRRNPNNTIALNYLAEMHWRKEELDEARDYWKRSLKIEDDPAIREKLERLDKEQTASANYDSSVTNHFLIRYDGGRGESSVTAEISEFLEEAYRRLSSQYELHPSEPFVVILYPRQQYFNVMDVPMWSAGANDGKIKLPIKGITSMNDELRGVLIHELSHSFVDLKTLKNCPGWLHEGLAKYSEGERVSQQGKQGLKNLIASNSLPRFGKLEGSFASVNAQTAAVLYLQSLSFIEYLIDRHRLYQMNQLLDRLGKQERLSEAFEQIYLVSLEDMENRWRTDLSLEE
jgi:tetratricopeptide (TPR) repeat protein